LPLEVGDRTEEETPDLVVAVENGNCVQAGWRATSDALRPA
jgi:hypothetical protein